MKKVFILAVILLFLPQAAYPFWIWSPKTNKWKNPQNSPLATPYLQYKKALRIFEEADYKEAYYEFRKLLIHYPDAKESAEAQFYLAFCLEKIDKPYEAFLQYQKLIDTYPNSQRINEVVEKQYNIGEFFLNRDAKKYLGVSFYDFVEHPSIEIFQTIVFKVPYSEYAPQAQYKLGMMFTKLGRYDEARDAFQKVIDDYPDSEWATPAKYQTALATVKAYPGADYDSSYVKDAARRLDEFIQEHPQAQISSSAEDQLGELRNREAKKNFDIAAFYELQNQYKSAIVYYRKVIIQYPDSDYYGEALKKIEQLQTLIDDNLTKGQFLNKQKREKSEEKQAAKLRLKQRKQEEKFIRIEAARQKKQEIKKAKLKKRQEIIDKKLVKKKEAIKKKQLARAAKLELKKESINKKLLLKKAKIEEKMRRIQEVKSRKEFLRLSKKKRREEKLALARKKQQEKLKEKE